MSGSPRAFELKHVPPAPLHFYPAHASAALSLTAILNLWLLLKCAGGLEHLGLAQQPINLSEHHSEFRNRRHLWRKADIPCLLQRSFFGLEDIDEALRRSLSMVQLGGDRIGQVRDST